MSVDHLLAQAFSSWEDWTAGATAYLGPDDLAQHIAGRQLEAISCHTLRPGAPAHCDVFPIALVRHPLDRAYSAYLHERRCPPNTLSCHVARATEFRGFVEWCLDRPAAGGLVIVNYQTVHLGDPRWRGHIYNAAASGIDLTRAKAVLDSLPVVGVVDRFDSFVSRLKPAMEGWLQRPLNIEGTPWENASGEPRVNLDQRLADLKERLGSQLYRRFEEANSYDLGLYDYASSLSGEQAQSSDRYPTEDRILLAS
jgi:hypothetical protein